MARVTLKDGTVFVLKGFQTAAVVGSHRQFKNEKEITKFLKGCAGVTEGVAKRSWCDVVAFVETSLKGHKQVRA